MRSHIAKIAPFTSQPATLGWIRHNIPHLPLQNIPHHTKFHITPCDTWLWWYYKYVVWCAVIVVRCSKPYHILRHAIIPHHIAPVPLAAHCSTLQYLISNRTIATLCIAFGTHFTSLLTPYRDISHIPWRYSDHTIYWLHLTGITPKSTSHYHVSHNIPHHTSVHPTTCDISHNTTSTTMYHAVSQPTLSVPHSTSHNVPHSMPQNTY